jgi:hypothetical protein
VSFLELAAERACDPDFEDDLDNDEQLELEIKAGEERN